MRSMRVLYGLLILTGLILLNVPVIAAERQTTHRLNSERGAGTVDRVEILLEVEGNLKVADPKSPESGQSTPVKMSATATLGYDEKSLMVPRAANSIMRSVRYYDKAGATIRVAEDEVQPALRNERRLIGVELAGAKATLFSPRGTLTREELDLIDALGNSLVLDRLLPDNPVAEGDNWKHPPEVLATLCGLEKVRRHDAQSTLISAADGTAKIEMTGRVEGTVGGLSSEIDVKAKYRFDMATKRITWFGLLVKENRTAGPVGPGLDVVARLQMKISPGQESKQLTDKALAGLPLEPSEELQQLSYLSLDGGWELVHDRRWVVIHEQQNSAILRMADGGDYVAQCNVAMTAGDAGKKAASLDAFQEDIQQALGKNFRQFLRAAEGKREAQERFYRVEVRGEVADMPIQWFYYLLTDRQDRRLVVAFTVKADLLDRFQEIDKDMVRMLRFGTTSVARR